MSEKSRHIGYKKCQNGRIVVLEILGKNNENRKDIVDKRFAKMRCSRARVIGIYDMHDPEIECEEAFGIRDKSFKYIVGEIVEPVDEFDEDLNVVCASGIHYFLREEVAYYWEYVPENGLYESWYENGQMWKRCTYLNGKFDGLYEVWYGNSQMHIRSTYLNGKFDGLYESWCENGQIKTRCTYKNGYPHGLYKSWYKTGKMSERCTIDALYES